MSFPRVLLGELVRPVERLEKPVAVVHTVRLEYGFGDWGRTSERFSMDMTQSIPNSTEQSITT